MERTPRYTETIKNLENSRANIRLELQEHVYSHYMRFIDIFKEFKEVQSVSIECYDPCFNTIKSSLKDILSTVHVKKMASSSSITKGTAEWWQELPDELDMLLADEKYEECIGIIEEAKNLSTTSDTVHFKLEFDVHVLKVIETIAKELQKSQVVVPEIYIGYLIRLDALPAAEDAYFIGKSQQLKLYMRRITITETPIEGIPKQCQVFVSLLRSTANESMKIGLSTAKLYDWITKEVKEIAWEIGETLHIVEKIDELSTIFKEVLKSFDALEQLGLSLSITFQYSFIPFVQKRIQELYVKEEGKVEVDIAGELWKPQVIQVEGSRVVLRLSSSCWGLYQQISRILQDCALFYDEHLKCFAALVPLFLKTMNALLEKYLTSDKFDDRKDPKIVMVIVGNFWNLGGLMPVLCKSICDKLRIPNLELPDIMTIETDALIRGDDILHSFAQAKWTDEMPSYLNSLHNISKLQSPDDVKSVLNLKHCNFIKEGIETVASTTDRNPKRIEKYCTIIVDAYIHIINDLLHLIGGNFEFSEFALPAFQQLITDLSTLDLLCMNYNVDAGIQKLIKKILHSYVKKKNTEEMLLKYKDEDYKKIYSRVFN